jgi:carboxylesterase type B
LILHGGEQDPPFRAAVPEYPWWQSYKSNDILNGQYTDLLAASNCSDLPCLRDLSFEELSNATVDTYQTGYQAGKYAYGDFYYGPTVDGIVIRDYPQREIEAGHFSKVALLIDHSAFEGKHAALSAIHNLADTSTGAAFTNFSTTTWNETVDNLKVLWPEASSAFFDRVEQLYPLSDFTGTYFNNSFFSSATADAFESSFNLSVKSNSEYWRAQQIYGDYVINCPTYYQALAYSEHDLPVYKLIFNAGTEIHAAPSPFLTTAASQSTNPSLARDMVGYWSSFTATLDPNAVSYSNASRTVWPQYTGGNRTEFQVLEVYPDHFEVRSDSDANERCEFFYGRSRVVLN